MVFLHNGSLLFYSTTCTARSWWCCYGIIVIDTLCTNYAVHSTYYAMKTYFFIWLSVSWFLLWQLYFLYTLYAGQSNCEVHVSRLERKNDTLNKLRMAVLLTIYMLPKIEYLDQYPVYNYSPLLWTIIVVVKHLKGTSLEGRIDQHGMCAILLCLCH